MTLLSLWLSASLASASTLGDGRECLAVMDIPCAERVVVELDAEHASSPDLLAFAANTAFHAARFVSAKDLIDRAVEAGWVDRFGDRELYARTLEVQGDWKEVQRDGGRIAYRPGVDVILVDEADDVLKRSKTLIAERLLGGAPPGSTRLEIYPNGRSFVDCSSLTRDDVQTTGVVALSKWSRLLLTSPRALGRGYDWKSTTAHEYIHLVVAHQTHDRAPVWFQEAVAKYLDNRWEDGADHFRLSVEAQGLLAKALRDDDLVSFEQMHPSLAKLPSAERASLAYAQVATMMAFAFQQGGEDVLLRVLPRIAAGDDAAVALATEAHFQDFDAFQTAWRAWVSTLDLVQKQLAALPTVLDGGEVVDADPVLAHRQDLARYLRLGDLLLEQGHPEAALVEYGKATGPDAPLSPLLACRMAEAWLAQDEPIAARGLLRESLTDYPEFTLSHKTLARVLIALGRDAEAYRSLQRAADLNPYDPEVAQSLADLASKAGDSAAAARYQKRLTLLRTGGDG